MQRTERNIGLDILRAWAISAVFVAHNLNIRVNGVNITGGLGTGVDLFFVLSGFLIGRIYFRSVNSGSFSFWNFWRARWWRTLPPYAATVTIYLILSRIFGLKAIYWYYWIFLQNYLPMGGVTPTWSLCVEEHFYLLLPVGAFAAHRLLGRGSMRYLLPVAFVAPLIMRFLTLALYFGQLPDQWQWYTHLHAEALTGGVWLAYISGEFPALFERLRGPAKWLLPVCPLTLLIFTTMSHERPVWLELCIPLIFAAGYMAWVRFLYDVQWNPVTLLGRSSRAAVVGTALCSYSIYLTHAVFDPVIRNQLLGAWQRGAGKSAVVMSSTWLLGVLCYFLVERPTILTRDRYLRSERSNPAGHGASPATAVVS